MRARVMAENGMPGEQPEYLTVRELAELLRVKERKVYSLAATGEIPCSRATGKLIFPRAGIESWMATHSSGGQAVPRPEPPAVFAGSHDPLLDWALRESRSGLASFFDGSLDGLGRLAQGEALAAGLHVFDAETGNWNRPAVVDALGSAPVVLLEWAWRERGLVVAPGNPKRIAAIEDLAGLTVMPRQPEAGSQVLLENLMARAGLPVDRVSLLDPPARSEADVALAVSEGKADAGLGLASLARQYRLDFVPLMRERFDIAVFRRGYFEASFQRLVAFCAGPAFEARAADLGGYDLSGFATVHYNAPGG